MGYCDARFQDAGGNFERKQEHRSSLYESFVNIKLKKGDMLQYLCYCDRAMDKVYANLYSARITLSCKFIVGNQDTGHE